MLLALVTCFAGGEKKLAWKSIRNSVAAVVTYILMYFILIAAGLRISALGGLCAILAIIFGIPLVIIFSIRGLYFAYKGFLIAKKHLNK